MARSLLDRFLEQSGTGITTDVYKLLEKEASCVVRAFGSVVGEEPDFDIKIERMKQQIKFPSAADDLNNVLELPAILAKVDSPMGRKIGGYTTEHKKLDARGIQEECLRGSEVVIFGSLEDKKGQKYNHVVHVRPLDGDDLICVSDFGMRRTMVGQTEAIVFRKK
ncbi:MAG: hypothetical protein WAV41_03165 [Microgenomates group bacterium]